MRPVLALVAVALGAALLFNALPHVDLGFSYAAFADGRFVLQDHPVAWAYRDARDWIGGVLVVLGFAGIVADRVRGRTGTRVLLARLLFVLLTFGLGAGLLADAVLKQNWNRARPKDLIEFGGTATYTPAAVIADQCDGNCAFVSGDAAFAFSLGAFGLVALRRRALWIGASLALGALVSLQRVLQGAHFVSDTLFAGLAVWLVMLALLPAYRWLATARQPAPLPAPAG